MKIFNKKNKSNQAVLNQSSPGEIKVVHDWELMVGVFLALVLIEVVSHGFLLMKVNSGGLFSEKPEVSTVRGGSGRESLTNAVDFFESRKAEYEASLSATSTEIDPSVPR